MDKEDISDDLYALACQPDLRVRLFSACLVDGVRYHTMDREENRRSQNSGVTVEGTHNDEYIDYYGRLKQIIQLQYNSDLMNKRSVVLFRCDWFDTHGKKSTRMKKDRFLLSINHGGYWYKDDPFILATHSTKVFYLNDIENGGNWRVVQKFAHRHLWSVAENDGDDEPQLSSMGLSYQDDHCVAPHVQVTEGTFNNVQQMLNIPLALMQGKLMKLVHKGKEMSQVTMKMKLDGNISVIMMNTQQQMMMIVIVIRQLVK